MIRYATVGAALALVAACGHADPQGRTMVPGGCAKPEFSPNPPGQPVVAAHRGTSVGVTFHRGQAQYAVDTVSLRMMPPGTSVGIGRAEIERTAAVLGVDDGPFAAAERAVTMTFDGVDRRGTPLPPGRYPVFVTIDTHNAGRCAYRIPSHVTGLVAVLDWRG